MDESQKPVGYKLLDVGAVLQPVEKIASRDGFELWLVDHPMAKFGAMPNTSFLAAFDVARKVWVGFIDLHHTTDLELKPSCVRSLKKLAARHPQISSTNATWVKQSMLVPPYRGKGLGVGLYNVAVALSARLGEAIVAGACVGDATLPAARRVWRSRRFREVADVEGLVATLRTTS